MKNLDYSICYPELSKEGQERTKLLVDKFKKQIEEIASNTLVDFADIMASEIVDDDAWISFRKTVIDALCGYGDREKKMAGTYDGQWWVTIRGKILEENREAIVTDILLDKEAEIKKLQEQVNYMHELFSKRY